MYGLASKSPCWRETASSVQFPICLWRDFAESSRACRAWGCGKSGSGSSGRCRLLGLDRVFYRPKADAYARYLKHPEKVMTAALVVYELYKKIKRERGEGMAKFLMAIREALGDRKAKTQIQRASGGELCI